MKSTIIQEMAPQRGCENSANLPEPGSFESTRKTNQELYRFYLACYEARDLGSISQMLAEDVTFRDWQVSVSGIEGVMAEIDRIFSATARLEIKPFRIYETEGSVSGLLRIRVNDGVELSLVIAIDFDSGGMIRAIRGYVGLGDQE